MTCLMLNVAQYLPVHLAVSVANCNTQIPALLALSLDISATRKIERMMPYDMQDQDARL